MQIIFHIDLNAFFASAEVSINPSLEGLPIVISSDSRRAIVSTASYEARKFGIHSAMPLFQAKQLCKELVIVPCNFELYHRLSNSFFDIIAGYSKILEVASIDECYVDMTKVVIERNIDPLSLAEEIQNKVLDSLKLKCSIGIAPNKFLAKMASDMKKPLGITVLTKSNLKEIMWPLDIKDMYGIGKSTCPKLYNVGIKTIGDVANYDNYSNLKVICGKHALLFYRKANGIDNSKIHFDDYELKSVGNSTTLQYDSTDIDQLYSLLKSLSKQVSNRAIKKDLISNSISITIKYTRFQSITRQTIISNYINDFETILSTAKYLFDQNYNNEPVRLLGVTLNNVISKENYKAQISLFDYQQSIQEDKTDILLKKLNEKLDGKLITASKLRKK